MPLILHTTGSSQPVSFDAVFEFIADLEALIGIRGDFASHFEFEADMDSVPALYASFDAGFEFVAALYPFSELLADFQSGIEFSANLKSKPAPTYSFNVTLNILPDAAGETGVIRVWLPRLLVDGVEIPIISWTAPRGEGEVGEKLSVVLQRWTDKDAFTDGAAISFGIGRKIAGVWEISSFKTLLNEGTFQVSTHTISGEPSNAADRVSITLTGKLNARLNTYPANSLVIYDDHLIVQQSSFYEVQYDQFGHTYSTILEPKTGLNLLKLLDLILIDRCGFAKIDTNLPTYQIVQAYFPIGTRYYDVLKQYLGIFSPLIYRDDDTIGILDATILKPAGFPDAETVAINRIVNQTETDDRSNRLTNAIRIRFINNVEDFDTITTRTDDPIFEADGENTVQIDRTWREYHKNSTPFILIRQELVSEIRTTRNPDTDIIVRSTETFTYTADNKPESRTQIIEGIFPDLASWIDTTLPPPYLFGEVTREVELFDHAAFPVDSLDGSDQRTYTRKRTVDRRGLILVNPVDQHLGKPFRQEFVPGIRSGNITPDVVFDSGKIKTTTEIGEPVTGGLVNVTTMVTDHLPAKEQSTTNYSQQRPGDITEGKQFKTNERIILIRAQGDTGPIQGIVDLHFGELSLEQAIPLAQRLNNLESPVTLTLEYIGYDETLRPGQVRQFTNRAGVILGTFMIIGSTPFGDAGGTFMNLTCRKL